MSICASFPAFLHFLYQQVLLGIVAFSFPIREIVAFSFPIGLFGRHYETPLYLFYGCLCADLSQ